MMAGTTYEMIPRYLDEYILRHRNEKRSKNGFKYFESDRAIVAIQVFICALLGVNFELFSMKNNPLYFA